MGQDNARRSATGTVRRVLLVQRLVWTTVQEGRAWEWRKVQVCLLGNQGIDGRRWNSDGGREWPLILWTGFVGDIYPCNSLFDLYPIISDGSRLGSSWKCQRGAEYKFSM